MNIFRLTPFIRDTAKKAFIKGELIRYVKNSSSLKAFVKMKVLFWTRLRRRGYPPKVLQPIFELVQYSRRNVYLVPKFKNMQHRNRALYFHTTYNFNHLRIGKILHEHLPDHNIRICYRKTKSLRNLLL